MKSRESFLWVALALTSTLVAIYCLVELLAARESVAARSMDLSECRNYSSDILKLSRRPRLASIGLDSPEQTIRRISEAMERAEVDPASLLTVAPSEPLRVAATQYRLRSTELTLSGISLAKLAKFAESITEVDDGSVLRDIVLTQPDVRPTDSPPINDSNRSDPSEVWDARLILTQLIYSPTSQ